MTECEGVFAQFKREGERQMIVRLLSENSLSSVAILLDMSENDIIDILRD